MKKLTKKQRNEMYIKALNLLVPYDTCGYNESNAMCIACSLALTGSECYFDEIDNRELILFTPLHASVYNGWLDKSEESFKIRQIILMFCIEMTN